MEKIELRLLQTEFTTNEDGEMFAEGLVNKTEEWSLPLGIRKKFVEKISKGVFRSALQDNQRIDFLMEHDTSKILSSTQNDSLELFEDEEGLKMRARIVPTTYGKDTYALMKAGIINHMSFGFKVISDKWEKRSDGLYARIINEVKLHEVSAVRNPAYPQSLISARHLEIVEDVEIPEEIRDASDVVEEPKTELIQTIQTLTPPEIKVDVSPYIQDYLSQVMEQIKTIDVEKINQIYEKVVVNEQPKQNNVVEVPVVEIKTEPVKQDLSSYYEKIKQAKEC